MLEYEWGNQPILLTGEEMNQEPNQTHQIFNPCDSNDTALPANFRSPNFSHSFHSQQSQPSLQPFVESRNYVLSHSFLPSASLSSTSGCSQAGISPRNEVDGIFAHDIVKNEDVYGNHFAARIGLNLGGRTYFSPEDDFVNRLYQRNRPISPGSNSPRCQAEGCNADLTHAKHYHRRHKVCEFHSKASTVIAGGLPQRFCQQCSRFHRLTEFDQGKRSCRKRLAEHNRRRRKNQQPGQPENHNPQSSINGAPANSSTDSVTIAVSPPGMNLLYSGQPSWQSSRHSSSCSPVMAFPADDSFRPYGRQIPNLEWNEEQ